MTRFIVRCEDGRVRHLWDGEGSFTSLAEARTWAEWGHCCTNRHTFEEAAVNGSEGCIVLDGLDGPSLWDCECSSCRRIVRAAIRADGSDEEDALWDNYTDLAGRR